LSVTPAPQPSRGRPAAGQSELITRRLVDAAWQVLLETGPEQFSLDRVAARAHASKQTIYARFSGKRDLLLAVLDARIGLIFAQFIAAAQAGELEAVIADVTRRSATTLTAPETMMLERLADWIDAPLGGNPTRAAIYGEVHELLRKYLRETTDLAGLDDAEIANAATFWLDNLIGHVRGVPRGGEELDRWSRQFARYFMLAVKPR
jgi:TetR/AcrR family transcriptional regulator, mexJK operon transcriptional repressor